MLVWQVIEEQARLNPNRPVLVGPRETLTRRELADRVQRVSRGLLATGLRPGDRLAVLLPNTTELAVTMLAANTAGIVVVPLHPTFPLAHMARALGDSAASAIVIAPALSHRVPADILAAVPHRIEVGGAPGGSASYEDVLEAGRRPSPGATDVLGGPVAPGATDDTPALLLFTSGTTGPIKATLHTQARLVARADQFAETMALGPSDEGLAVAHLGRPFYFVYLLLAMMRAGGAVSLVEEPDPDLCWQVYRQRRPTYSIALPSFLRALFGAPSADGADHTRLRFLVTGGETAGRRLHRLVREKTGRPLLEMYGLTETGALAVTPPGDPIEQGSFGRPMRGVEMRLTDESGRPVPVGTPGRLWVRSSTLMLGFWNDEVRTRRAFETGWFDTQDLARIDADGNYWFEGRVVDAIVRNGVPIAARTVAEAMLDCPGIDEAVIVGIDDGRGGQLPAAFYLVAAGVLDPGPEAVRAHLEGRVDAASMPVACRRLDRWPLNFFGKLDTDALKRMAKAGQA